MAEYIERKALLEALNSDILNDEGCPMFVAATVEQIVSMAPTANVEPVRHGRWQNKKSPWSQGGYMTACSYCHESIASLSGKLKFCPNCGAKMDWDDENEP